MQYKNLFSVNDKFPVSVMMIAGNFRFLPRRLIWIMLWVFSTLIVIFVRDAYHGQFEGHTHDSVEGEGMQSDFGSADLWTGIPASLVTSEANDQLSTCKCSQIPLAHKAFYTTNLNLVMPDRNMTTMEHLQKHHPNFPISITSEVMDKRCHLMPQPHAIAWSNIYWQKLKINENAAYLLYSAILDNREQTDIRPCLRILAHAVPRTLPVPWCYIWFNASGPPVIAKVIRTYYLRYKGNSFGDQRTLILTCRIPPQEAFRRPKAVSLVKTPCSEAHTLLEVVGAMERDETTAYIKGKPPADGNK